MVIEATPQGMISLPSALTNLVLCMGSMCVCLTRDCETTEHDALEFNIIKVMWLLSEPFVCAALLVCVLSMRVETTCVYVCGLCVVVWALTSLRGVPLALGIWVPPCPFPWFQQSLATCPILPQLKHLIILCAPQFLARCPGWPQLKQHLAVWDVVSRLLRGDSCSVTCNKDCFTQSRQSFSFLTEFTGWGLLFRLNISWSSRALAMVAK